jgi:hypothetical protein
LIAGRGLPNETLTGQDVFAVRLSAFCCTADHVPGQIIHLDIIGVFCGIAFLHLR